MTNFTPPGMGENPNTSPPVNRQTSGQGEGSVIDNATAAAFGPGLPLWNGTIFREYDNAMRPWSRAMETYLQMMNDATVGATIEALKTPLLSAKFRIVAASNDPLDKDAAHFLEDAIHSMVGVTWQEHVNDMLDCIPYGFAIADKVLERRADGRFWLATLVPVAQETLDRWGDLDKYGRITSFTQLDPKDYKRHTAPMDKILHFKYRSRAADPHGMPMLRSIYRAWYYKNNLEALEAMGIERDVGNVPIATRPEGAMSDVEDRQLKEMLEAFRQDEASYAILPHGVTLDAYTGGGRNGLIRTVIRDYQHAIRQRAFVDFIGLGAESGGSQALAKESTGFLSLALESIQNMMVDVWNTQLVRYLFRYNAFPNRRPPKMDWISPSRYSVQTIAQAMSTAKNAEVFTATQDDEDHFRAIAGLPPRPESLRDRPRGLESEGQPTNSDPATLPAPGGPPSKAEDVRPVQQPSQGMGG